MPDYLTTPQLWVNILPLLLAPPLVAGTLYLSFKPRSDEREWFVPVWAFTFLGMVTGFTAGLSRDPVIGAVVPAVLTLVAGVGVYTFSSNDISRLLISLCIVGLSTTLLLGAFWGAFLRDEYQRNEEMFRTSEEYQMQELKRNHKLERRFQHWRERYDSIHPAPKDTVD